MLAKLFMFEEEGLANAREHLEKPKGKIVWALRLVFVADCSARTFSPTIPRSATPLETREGISSSRTSKISIFIFEDRARSFSPDVRKFMPDFSNKFLLLSESLPFF